MPIFSFYVQTAFASRLLLAHNILYTYIAPYVVPAGLGPQISTVLLVFGVTALAGMFITGALIDRHLRQLTLLSIGLFLFASLALAILGAKPVVIYVSVAIWGLAFGGMPAIVQTASAHTAGRAADVAQSIIVTVWNVAIAGAGVIGGVLIDTLGLGWLAWVLVALLVFAFIVAWRSHRHGFRSDPVLPTLNDLKDATANGHFSAR